MSDYPWPKTEAELIAYIREQLGTVEYPEGYGLDETPEREAAMSKAYNAAPEAVAAIALAAYRYAASTLGLSGFQASCADLQILKVNRGFTGPFAIVDGENMLYPQYDLRGQLDEWLEGWLPWAREQAAKKLLESNHAAPAVREHWQWLVTTGDQP